jgi:hypothetical protein
MKPSCCPHWAAAFSIAENYNLLGCSNWRALLPAHPGGGLLRLRRQQLDRLKFDFPHTGRKMPHPEGCGICIM